MILIVDSGSTKCDWLPVDEVGNQLFEKQRTKGLNPDILPANELTATIKENSRLIRVRNEVDQIFFYGAGCGSERSKALVHSVLQSYFYNAKIIVKEDTYAAAYSTIGNGHNPAVVCILGTGSNCSYYDGEVLHQKVHSLGYSVMDDASGNYFGRHLLRDYFFKNMPETLRIAMADRFNLDADHIKASLYKMPNPNAYLANFAEFMFLNKELPYVANLIKDGIRLFSKNYILQFKDKLDEVPVHFAGSIGYFAKNEIQEVAHEFGYKPGNFVRRPIDGLVNFHLGQKTV